jgi:hypothetical protein
LLEGEIEIEKKKLQKLENSTSNRCNVKSWNWEKQILKFMRLIYNPIEKILKKL